ncbi:CPBP family glutamic-type intramembrane protease [Arthrobacter sp. CP30]
MDQLDQHYAYHRLARSWPQYRWWKPLLTGLLGLAFYLALTVLLLVVGVVAALATSADTQRIMEAAEALDLSNPVIFAFTLVSLILMIPALGMATFIIGPKPIGLLSSVAGRIRWRWLVTCVVTAIAVFLASLLVSTLLTVVFPEDGPAPFAQQDTSVLWIMLALSLLAVPFQAAAEEYVFRGYLMQAIGGWLRHPAFAILLPIPLFVLGHGYDPLGQADVAVFALFAGWITWRTGGLEAAIAVHAINNMTIFVLGAVGVVDVNNTEGSVGGLVVSVATMAVTAAVIVRLANRRGIGRTRPGAAGPTAARPDPVPAGAGQGAHPGFPGGMHAVAGVPAQVRSWDPTQYGTGRYGTDGHVDAPITAHSAAPLVQHPAGPTPAPLQRPVWQDPFGSPVDRPRAGAAQPAPGRDYTADRHPPGPSHPGGPGYPAGTPYPSGPGYPAATSAASAARPDSGDGQEARDDDGDRSGHEAGR